MSKTSSHIQPFYKGNQEKALLEAAIWRMKNAHGPVSILLASSPSANPVYLHRITFLPDGRWCFANAYERHAGGAQ